MKFQAWNKPTQISSHRIHLDFSRPRSWSHDQTVPLLVPFGTLSCHVKRVKLVFGRPSQQKVLHCWGQSPISAVICASILSISAFISLSSAVMASTLASASSSVRACWSSLSSSTTARPNASMNCWFFLWPGSKASIKSASWILPEGKLRSSKAALWCWSMSFKCQPFNLEYLVLNSSHSFFGLGIPSSVHSRPWLAPMNEMQYMYGSHSATKLAKNMMLSS